PAKHQRERTKPVVIGPVQRVEQVLRAGGLDVPADKPRDVAAFFVLSFVAVIQLRERLVDRLNRSPRLVQQPDKRPHHVFIAKLSKRISRRNAQHLVLQQRNETRHNAPVANPDQCVQRGKRQKKISRVDYLEQRFNRFGRAKLSERFDRVISNVHIRIVENVHQRQKRATVALLSKRVRGVDAQFRIAVAKTFDQRLDRIQTAQRQYLKCAVEDAQVPVFVPQRAQQR